MEEKGRTKEQIYLEAKKIYRKLKSRWGPQHKRKIVAIDASSGNYIIGEDELDVALKVKKQFPGKVFNFFRIGYPAVHKFRRET